MHFVLANTDQIQQKWDALVKKHNASVFSTSAYLNAVSTSWMILYNNDETEGIACPFTRKMGVNFLVSPFFFRYVEWVGTTDKLSEAIPHLQAQFQVCDLSVNSVISDVQKRYQVLEPNTLKLNQQAKRSLAKAANFAVQDFWSPKELITLIREELNPRISTLNHQTDYFLAQLIKSHQALAIRQLNLLKGETWQGGIWLLETEKVVYYLKGTVKAEAKKNGGMYLLIQEAITQAHQTSKTFDFGGSDVENVRRFNLNFGGEDVFYGQMQWNHAPWWWKIARWLKNRF